MKKQEDTTNKFSFEDYDQFEPEVLQERMGLNFIERFFLDLFLNKAINELDDGIPYDNIRFAINKPPFIDWYRYRQDEGCCGFFDSSFFIFRRIHYGFNYGH